MPYPKIGNYRVWVYRRDGTKFVSTFKNKREANDWSNRVNASLGSETTAGLKRNIAKDGIKYKTKKYSYYPQSISDLGRLYR